MNTPLAPKKVLHVIETGGPGGAETAFVNIAAGLNPERFVSGAATPRGGGWLEDRLRERGLSPDILPSGRGLDLKMLMGLVRLIRKGRYRLIHSHLMDMNFYASLAGFLTRVPVIATEHGDVHHPAKADSIRPFKPRTIHRLSARYVSVSDHTRITLQERYGLSEKGMVVLPNGIDTARFEGAPVQGMEREALGLPREAFLIGAVGNLYPVKGHRFLIEALAQLDIRAHVAIAGRGEAREELLRLASDLGVSDRVHLLGLRNDIPRLLKAFDLFALPSESEAHPLSLLEAMASGLVPVASRVGGIPEVIEEGVTGLLFPVGEPDAIAKAIRELMESPEIRIGMGETARRRVKELYSTERMLDRYQALYAEVLGKP